MNLVGAIGMRTVYSWKEVCGFLGMRRSQVKWLVASGRLAHRFNGLYPFAQQDVNQFITHLNAGKVQLGVKKGVTA